MKRAMLCAVTLASSVGLAPLAHAEMVLSQVIVDLLPDQPPREDIEVWNDGDERIYVVADAFEITKPGTAHEKRLAVSHDEKAGLIVSPRRLILEPNERRTIRIAAYGERPTVERTYRVAIKPVAGPLTAQTSALKMLVGFDTLILVRPRSVTGDLEAERTATTLTIRNAGNASQEIFAGSQCVSENSDCSALPAKRLYPGAVWTQNVLPGAVIRYKSAIGPTIRERKF